MKVFLVKFHTGEWDNYREVILRIYDNLLAAQEYANQLRAKLDSMGRHTEGNNSSSENQETRYDDVSLFEEASIDYSGAWITVSNPYPVYKDNNG